MASSKSAKKKILPSKTSLAKQAKACILDPRVPGPFKVIADAMNADYYMNRAIESIHQAQANEAVLETELQQAVSLLLLTMEVKRGERAAQQQRSAGSGNPG